jgi:SAM-dependent methyltransferase
MQGWTNGYVTGIPYGRGFHAPLSPWLMGEAARAALGGVYPAWQDDFSYCELGCGHGVSLAMAAAAHPRAWFFANDFNIEAMQWLQALLREAEIGWCEGLTPAPGRVGLSVAPFAALADAADAEGDAAPLFDMIALHGVWSWVGDVERRCILRFIDRRLKPGGFVYLGWNAMPGWSALLPLRALMAERAMRQAGPLAGRIEAALEQAARLERLGGGYFAAQPAAAARLHHLLQAERGYLAHEYFNQHWQPAYITETAHALADVGLDFLTQVRACDRRAASELDPWLTPLVPPELEGQALLVHKEFLRDFYENRAFRRDLFWRPSTTMQVELRKTSARPCRFAALAPAQASNDPPLLPHGGPAIALTLDVEVATAILSALAGGPLGLMDLVARLAGVAAARIEATLDDLLALEKVAPAMPKDQEASERVATCRRLNQVILRRALTDVPVEAMASPVLGGGLAVDRLEQLFLIACAAGDDPPDFARRTLATLNPTPSLAAATLDTAAMQALWRHFLERRWPILQALIPW